MVERAAVRMLIKGRVQGVGFRYFTQQWGRQLGLVGRVRNLTDGSVEVRAAGDEVDLMRLKAQLAEGPPGAQVSAIEDEPLAEVPAWDGFDVAYR